MRKSRRVQLSDEYKIIAIDDEQGILDSIQSLLNRNGYMCVGFTDPLEGLEEIRNNHYDLLVLDYFMQPIHGEQVVEEIRKTNSELYILLLTGHKDLAPPISTIKSLDIQAYCEKSDRLDQLQLLIRIRHKVDITDEDDSAIPRRLAEHPRRCAKDISASADRQHFGGDIRTAAADGKQ